MVDVIRIRDPTVLVQKLFLLVTTAIEHHHGAGGNALLLLVQLVLQKETYPSLVSFWSGESRFWMLSTCGVLGPDVSLTCPKDPEIKG